MRNVADMLGFQPHIQRRIAGATALAVLSLGGCGGEAVDKTGGDARKVLRLTLAHHSAGTEGVSEWVDAVERLSDGTIDIVVKPGWREGERAFEAATIKDVQEGRADVASVAARAFDEAGVTTFEPLEAPLLIDSRELERKVLRGEIGRAALKGTDEIGLAGLALMPTDLRRPVGLTRELVEPGDWRGAKVYTREGGLARRTLEALGAEVVHQPTETWFKGVDGAEMGVAGVRNQPEVARKARAVTANVVLWPQLLTIVMRRTAFDALSEVQRRALAEAGGAALAQESKFVTAIAKEDEAVVCRLGVKLVEASPSQLSALAKAVEPVYAAISAHPGNEAAIEAIRELKDEGAADALTCAGKAGRPAVAGGGNTKIAGTYEASVTERELSSSDLLYDRAEINDENWGDFTLRFASDGTFRIDQRNSREQSEYVGTYAVEGDVLTLEAENLGETFVFHWSLYRDRLTLTRDEKLGISPTPFLLRAFRRAD